MIATHASVWRPACRCCRGQGLQINKGYKYISTEYDLMGKREIFEEMLIETFNLKISFFKPGEPNDSSHLICEPCILRLRDAAAFKRQVQECEQWFIQLQAPRILEDNTDEISEEILLNWLTVEEEESQNQTIHVEEDNSASEPINTDDCNNVCKGKTVDPGVKATKVSKKSPAPPAAGGNLDRDLNNDAGANNQSERPLESQVECDEEFKAQVSSSTYPRLRLTRIQSWVVKTKEKGHTNVEKDKNKVLCSEVPGKVKSAKPSVKHKNNAGKPHPCKRCGKAFRLPRNLHKHQLTHPGERLYFCDYCEESFALKNHLRHHINVHMNKYKKRFKCSFCGVAFTRAYNLNRHQMIHSGERPHKCNLCDMTFAQVSNLRQHQLIHSGEKPYKCSLCDKIYSRATTLRLHQLHNHMG